VERSNAIALGIGAGMAAGALWGSVFLAPKLVPDFSALQQSAGRYIAYGLLSAVLIAPRWRSLRTTIGWSEWRALIWLSVRGNLLYYVFLAEGVLLAGVAATTLIIGFLPVAVTIIGSRDHGAVPLRKLVVSLALGLAGIVCVGWQSLGGVPDGDTARRLTGLLCAAGALVSWTSYAVSNSRWLARLHHVSSHEWSLLTGVATGALAVLLAVPAFLSGGAHDAAAWTRFGAVAGGVAIFASVIGNAFWNRASRLLPLTMTGQLILFETLFALLYGFLWEQRWPTMTETLAIALLSTSVLSCATAHRTKP
jgi:drug/metabolite transporter (DMT)-like permease